MTLVPQSGPGKLSFDFDPVGLWLFDGDLTDEANGNTLTTKTGSLGWTTMPDNRKAVQVTGTDVRTDADVPALHPQRVSDALTAQALVRFSQNGIDSFGSRIFSVEGPGGSGSDENVLFKLMLYNTGSRMILRFSWEKLNGTEEITDANFDIVPGAWYHIAAVREASNLGLCDAQLYVNNVLVGSDTGLGECVDGGASNISVGFGQSASTAVQGLKNGTTISCLKLCAQALTADDIRTEWGKVQGLL